MTAGKITRCLRRASAAVFGVLLAGGVVFVSSAANEAAPASAVKAPETTAAPAEKPAAPAEAAASAEPKPAAPEEPAPAPPPPPSEGGPPPAEKPADAPAAPAEASAKDAAPATSAAPNGKDAPEHKGLSFETFRILIDKNIFSAKRVPKSAASAAAKDAVKPKTQVLRLMGTYLTPERTLALFEGTDSVPGGGIKQGETIAGYRVEEVRVNGAVLSNDKGKIEIPVGSGLSQAEDKSWTLVDKPVVEHSAAASSAAQPGTSPAAAANDPIEKLRARRRKELGQ